MPEADSLELLPSPGTVWKKPSFPVPTIATVEAVNPDTVEVCLKAGRQRAWWPVARFHEEFKPYPACLECGNPLDSEEAQL